VALCYDPLETVLVVAGFASFVVLGVRWFATRAIDDMVTVLNQPCHCGGIAAAWVTGPSPRPASVNVI
jgi:hypothetical protein